MANIKISGLYNIGTGIADEDLFVVVDNSALTSNSMSWANIIALANTHIQAKIDALIDSAPDALNTLNELAAALGDDENFASTITISLGQVSSNTVALQGGIEGTNSLIASSNTAVVSSFQSNDFITFTRLDANINLVQDNVASLSSTVDTKDSVANVYSTYLTLSGGLTGANTTIATNEATRVANAEALAAGIAAAGGADLEGLETRLNANIDIVQDNVASLSTTVDTKDSVANVYSTYLTLSGGLTGANTNISSNDTDILNLITGLGGSNTRISAEEANVIALQGGLAGANTALSNEIAATDIDITNLVTGLGGSNTRIASEEANVIALQSGISGSNSRISAEEANVIALQGGLTGANTAIASNDTDILNLVTGLGGSNTLITALEARRNANTLIFEGAFTGSNTRIAAEEANVIALQGGIEGANTTISTLDTVANVYATYTRLDSNINVVQDNVASLVTGLDGSNTNITALEARRAANTSIFLGAHSGANTRITAEEANVIALQGGIAGANSAISGNDTDITNLVTGLEGSNVTIATKDSVANVYATYLVAKGGIDGANTAISSNDTDILNLVTGLGGSNTLITALEARRAANTAILLGAHSGANSRIAAEEANVIALQGGISGANTAIGLRATTDSPTFTGIPAAPTAAAGTSTTQIATTAFVGTAVANIVDSAPEALNTLNELAAALGDDANFSATVSTQIGTISSNTVTNATNITAVEARRVANIAGAVSSITTSDLTASRALASDVSGKVAVSAVTSTELGYLTGVTSAIQTQLDGKQASGSYLTGNQTITLSGDVSGSGTTAITVTIADDSHNHIISNIDNLQTTLDAKDTVANVYSTYLTLLGGLTGANSAISTNESTRSSNAAELAAGIASAGGTMTAAEIRALGFFDTSNDGAGSGLDADLLDGISSASFLRSDTSDSITSGSLTLDAGNITINNGTNLQINLQASDGAIEITRAAGGAYIDFKNTTAEDYDARLQESGGSINLNGNRILTTADEGSGNGLDADTLDGVQGASYLRSDASDTYTGQLDITSGQNIRFGHANQSDANDGKIGAGLFTSGLNIVGTQTVAAAGRRISIYGTMYDGSSSNKYWHAGIDGAGSGLDADTLDGVEGASYLRSDTSDTFTGTLTVSGDITTTGDIYLGGGQVHVASGNLRTKYSMWGDNDTTYGIGMFSAFTYGGLNDYAMTFQMNDDVDRGFWWGDNIHTAAQGAMSLTTIGELTVAKSISIAGSESVTSATTGLYMYDDGNPHVHGDNNLWVNATSGNLYLNNQYSGNIIMTNGTGNVGIGTSAPATKVHITSAGSTYTHPADNDLPTLYLYNTNNASTNAHAILTLRTAGSAGGDPFVSFDIAGEAGWALGVDNSDSNKFKISSAWTNVATNTELTLDNSGNLSVVGKLQESGSNLIPAGFIGMWGAAAAPSGWYLCEGGAISRTTYSALFSAIGTTYGAGDGSTTFNVPDFRDRAPYGASTYLIGSKTASEIDVNGQLASASGGPTTHSVTTSTTNSTTDKDVTNSITVVTAVNAHSTHTHTITYPAVAVKFIIKT